MPRATVVERLVDGAARERIRLHLAVAELRLRLRGPPAGTDPNRRTRCLDALRRYWLRGEFPTNRAFPIPTPSFRDADGVRCAVAELAAAEGRSDVVDAVSREANHVDLTADEPPAVLEAWLTDAPLTEDEAAYVQPMYPPEPPIWATGILGVLFAGAMALLGAQAWMPRLAGSGRRAGRAAVLHGQDGATSRRAYTAAFALGLGTAVLVLGGMLASGSSIDPFGVAIVGGVAAVVAGAVIAAGATIWTGGLLPSWALGTAPLVGLGVALGVRLEAPLAGALAIGVGLPVYALPAATLGYLLGMVAVDDERVTRPSRLVVGVLAGYVIVVAVGLLALQRRWIVL